MKSIISQCGIKISDGIGIKGIKTIGGITISCGVGIKGI